MAALGGVPVIILKEGTQRESGREAIENNIMAARAVANAVKTTLGPKGMDKLLVDALGDVTITNDGVTILREMEVQHPAAKMVVEASKTQDKEVGDGTTTVAILIGELLKHARELMEKGLHPTVIARGYSLAAGKAVEFLNSIARDVPEKDRELLEKVAITAMTGKLAETPSHKVARYAVDLVLSTVDKFNGKTVVDLDNVMVEKRVGGGIEDSELVQGVIIDKERVHQNMPTRVENARIALLNVPIERRDTETKAEISITSGDQFQLFMDHEKEEIRKVVDKVIRSGANVVFCQKGIDDLAQHFLAKAGIMAYRRMRKSDLEKLSRATGGRLITNLDELKPDDLGEAALVEERIVGAGPMTFVTGCRNPGYLSLILRGGTQQVVDSLERALDDALHAVATAIESGKLLAGGGAPETAVSIRLRQYAASLKGREQLAVEKFAEAIEVVPKTLAENAGFNPIDKMVALRSKHEKFGSTYGLNAYTGEIVDMWDIGVVEPLRVKVQAIYSATDAANLILRIDDVIAAKKKEEGEEKEGQMQQGGMPGMGGMGGMGGFPPGMM
ncbi:MAG: thermosome subunit beta [Methanothrix sp.]